MKPARRGGAALAVVLLGLPLALANLTGAQEPRQPADAPHPPFPAHVHRGNCDALIGPDFARRLSPVAVRDGQALGLRSSVVLAEPLATSYSTLTVPLAELVEEAHAIDLHPAPGNEERFVACGEIAGVPGLDGALTIGIRAAGASGFDAVGILVPNPSNPGFTNVSIVLVGDPAGGGGAAAGAAPTVDAGTEEP